ncbi:MAG: BamA/TamA family outer membrane protein [Haliangium ochraceum]
MVRLRRPSLLAVPPLVAVLAMVSCLTALGPRQAAAEPARALGRLEQESTDEALAALGLHVDPRPEGKIVGTITVVNQEVFSRRDWWFQFFNLFHRTTRPEILRRELLFTPNTPYDATLIEESIRNLQSPSNLIVGGRPFGQPELSSVVVIVPVASPRAGIVDLLVVTRDVWSLRFNTNFEFQQNTLSLLETSMSENNLFGWRKYLSVGFTMDQGAYVIGPTYFDPNVGGSRLTLLASASASYARGTNDYEGNRELFSLRYPLFSLASRWGGGVDVRHQDAVIRTFRGNSLRRLDLPGDPAGVVETVPYEFRRTIAAVDGNVVRSFGASVIQRVTAGYLFDGRRSSTLPTFPGDPADPQRALDQQRFLLQFTPISEQRSEPYLVYETFTPRYDVYRDLDTFDLRENRRLGPSAEVRVGFGVPALGADFAAVALDGAVSWAVGLGGAGGGYGSIALGGGARLRDGRFIDQSAGGRLYAASPSVRRLLRLVVSVEAGAYRADTQKRQFILGGATGMRGYAIGDFLGTTQIVAHTELRTAPLPVLSQRFGALLFYDVGDAASSFAAVVLHHDVGLGLRWLIPQLNSSVIRADWAIATQSTPFTAAGLPGRVSAGFQQVF